MSKNGSAKIYTNICNRLTLSLINSHSKSKTNRNLKMKKTNRKITLRRMYVEPGNKNLLSSMITTQNPTPQHPLPNIQQNHASTIAKTIDNIYIVQEHERAARLEIQVSQRQAGCVKGVEKLNRVYEKTPR